MDAFTARDVDELLQKRRTAARERAAKPAAEKKSGRKTCRLPDFLLFGGSRGPAHATKCMR